MDARPPLRQELPSLIHFLNRELRPEVKWSISEEYPFAFDAENLSNIRFINENADILSHAVTRPVTLRTPYGYLKVLTIGSVVTHSKYRGAGCSKKVLLSCIEHGRSLGADVAILWSNLHDFYSQFGFQPAGGELIANIPPAPLPPEYEVRRGAETPITRLNNLYTQHTVASLRSDNEFKRFLSIPNARITTLWKQQSLLAFAVEGKGLDLQNHIHEWGGKVGDLLTLVSAIASEEQSPINLMIPTHAHNLIKEIRQRGWTTRKGILGLLRVLNWQSLAAKAQFWLQHHAQGPVTIKFHNEGSENFASIVQTRVESRTANPNKQLSLDLKTEADLVQCLFGPLSPNDKKLLQNFKGFTSALPLPFWVWGWDSI